MVRPFSTLHDHKTCNACNDTVIHDRNDLKTLLFDCILARQVFSQGEGAILFNHVCVIIVEFPGQAGGIKTVLNLSY